MEIWVYDKGGGCLQSKSMPVASVPNPFSKSNNLFVKFNNFHNTQQIQRTQMDYNGTSTLMHQNKRYNN
jgi:hypothetical protein